MSDLAINIQNLSKQYKLGEVTTFSIRDYFSKEARSKKSIDRPEKYFWALKDLNIKINAGEVCGIIGKNGAGKSTLLKVLSRITKPTKGLVEINGRVGSLLEVGTGFHPELSGRENIFLNGTILGMSRFEIKSKLDEIISFSGVEKFIDTPVKHYSSGMYVRLAFAVAANLEPEILIIDEVLAVGDLEFQKKCLGKMSDVARSGRTILFVSHHLNSLRSLCRSGIVLEKGANVFNGEIKSAIEFYLTNHLDSNIVTYAKPEKRENFDAYVLDAKIIKASGIQIQGTIETNEEIWIQYNLLVQTEIKNLHLTYFIENTEGECIYFNDRTDFSGGYVSVEKGIYEIRTKIPNPLLIKGTYFIRLGVINNDEDTYNFYERILSFELIDTLSFRTGSRYGYIFQPTEWQIKQTVFE